MKSEVRPPSDAFDRRPPLAAALATARQQKCPVLVAKLDRLPRHVAFSRIRRLIGRARRQVRGGLDYFGTGIADAVTIGE